VAIKPFGLNSEYGSLTSVLLYRPGPEIGNHADPPAIQHLTPIDHDALMREFDCIIDTYNRLGVRVIQIDAAALNDDRMYLYNLMFCRDLVFMTPEGAVLSSMANRVRREEVRYAERTLRVHNIPVIHTVLGEGRFEGADALWVNDRLVIIGVGNRTNEEAYRQIKEVLKERDIECISLPFSRKGPQHLLGTVQLVDGDLALVRNEIADAEVVRFLEEHGFSVIRIPENSEVRTRQAMNIVTVAPRTILMTAACPETKEIYVREGLEIVAELELTELMKGAGGLACATGIISREKWTPGV
jgi:N-dimethylarginine dimethylaminohydrolase